MHANYRYYCSASTPICTVRYVLALLVRTYVPTERVRAGSPPWPQRYPYPLQHERTPLHLGARSQTPPATTTVRQPRLVAHRSLDPPLQPSLLAAARAVSERHCARPAQGVQRTPAPPLHFSTPLAGPRCAPPPPQVPQRHPRSVPGEPGPRASDRTARPPSGKRTTLSPPPGQGSLYLYPVIAKLR